MTRVLALLLLPVFALPVRAAERFPDIPPSAMTPEQKAIVDAIASGPRKNATGPFQAWLRSPELDDRLQKVGEYVRFQLLAVGRGSTEFAILRGRPILELRPSSGATIIRWPLAAGVPVSVLADVSEGREPVGMTEDEALVYGFTAELRRDKDVSDATYAKVLARFGERGIVDLIAVQGYYDVVCMTLNVAQVPVPQGSKVPPLASLH